MSNKLTQKRAIELFSYNRKTGKLTNRIQRNNRNKIGDLAGTLKEDGYRRVEVDGMRIYAHHIVWLIVHGKLPTKSVDHINNERGDNRIKNLREATQSEQQKNHTITAANTSGANGTELMASGRWRAQIKVDGKSIQVGTYDTQKEAVAARKKADATHGFDKTHGDEK